MCDRCRDPHRQTNTYLITKSGRVSERELCFDCSVAIGEVYEVSEKTPEAEPSAPEPVAEEPEPEPEEQPKPRRRRRTRT